MHPGGNQYITDLGKFLIGIGLVLVVAGAILTILGRTNLPIGRLPGDIFYRGKHATFYFPLVTCLLLSAILSFIFYVLGRFGR